jgi:hypothetical protein
MTPTVKAAITAIAVLFPLAACAQTTYRSPDGAFSVDIPANWKLSTDPSSNQIDAHSGPVSFSVTVTSIPQGAAASDFLEASDAQLQKQCPTYKHRDTHPITLAGLNGLASVSTCNDPRSPAIAETSAALTPSGLLANLTAVAPAEHYADSIAIFATVKASLHVPALPATASPSSTNTPPTVADIKRDCAAGRYSQEECSRRLGIALSANAPDTQHIPNATSYHDPQNRFTVDIPPGWTATSEGDNGILGVQLSHAKDWIDIMPSTAPSASEAVLAREREMIQKSHLTRTAPFSPTGLIQIFGHGTELTYDTTDASSPDGTPIDAIIAAIAPATGGPAKLLFETSTAHTSDNVGLAVALSIRLP